MAHHHGKSKRPSRMTVPDGAHGLARIVFAEARRQCKTYEELDLESGVLRGTIKEWRKPGKLPHIVTVEAALTYLGWDVAAVPFANAIASALRRDLGDVIARHASTVPALALLADIPTRPH